MKKLYSLLVVIGLLFSGCDNSGIEEEKGGENYGSSITLSQSVVEVEQDGEECNIEVTSSYSWQASSDFDWIHVETTAGVSGTETLSFYVDENPNLGTRKGAISIRNKWLSTVYTELLIIQEGAELTFECPEKIYLSSEGGERLVEIVANFEYEVTGEGDWFTYEQTDEGIIFSAATSEVQESRTGTITISNERLGISKIVEVIQSSFVPEITVEESEFEFTVNGGSKNIYVESNVEYEVVVDVDWITYTKDEAGIGIEVAESDDIKERTAKIVLLNNEYGISKSVTVSQAPFVPEISISNEELTFVVEGDSQEVEITANFDYEVSVLASWITCEKTETGISVTVPELFSIKERSAKIVISNEKLEVSEVIQVIQEPFVAEFAVVPGKPYFDSKASSKTLQITANFEYEVSASADWLTYKKVANGVEVSVKALTGEDRSTKILVSNETYGIKKYIEVYQGATRKVPANEIHYTTSNGEIVTLIEFVDSDADFHDASSEWFDYINGGTNAESARTRIADAKPSLASKMAALKREGKGLTAIKTMNSATRATFNYTDEDIFGAKIVSHTYEDGIGRIVFDKPVTKVANFAFAASEMSEGSCKNLTSVNLPDGVEYIGNQAFYWCSNLQQINLPSNLKAIGDWSFCFCFSLTSISLPKNLIYLGDAFIAAGLTTIEIPENTKFGYAPIAYCSNLKSITGKHASSDKRALLKDNGLLVGFAPAGLTTYTFPSDVTGIYYLSCWDEYTPLTKPTLATINVPETVSTIGEYAFADASYLENITLPSHLTDIPDGLFNGCTSLKNVTIPNGVMLIGSYAFYGCESLSNITIPNGVSSIGQHAFVGCAGFTKMTIPASVEGIGERAFSGCTGELVIDSTIVQYDQSSYSYDLWWSGAQFSKITLGDNVKTVGKYAFYKYTALETLVLGSAVTTLGRDSFSGCSNLKSVSFNDELKDIDDYSFNDCVSLSDVVIPAKVTHIGYEAFHNCPSLSKIYCKATTPPTIESYTFDTYSDTETIYVPSGSVSSYKSKWSRYSSMIVGYDF